MKEYKGWEIVKMIAEGILKEGDNLLNENNIKFYVEDDTLRYGQDTLKTQLGDETHVSWLSDNKQKFKIIQTPVSFMDVVNSNKLCRVEYEDCGMQTNEGFQCLDSLLHFLSNKYPSSLLREIIKDGRWYLEESEVEK